MAKSKHPDPIPIPMEQREHTVPPSNEMSPEQDKEFERLWEAFQKNREKDGGVWPEYTGPGK